MKSCWNLDGDSRPTFHHLSVHLTDLSKEREEERLYTKNISEEYYATSVAEPKPTLTEKDYLQLL